VFVPCQEPRGITEPSSLRHSTAGRGFPVAAHRSRTFSPSWTIIDFKGGRPPDPESKHYRCHARNSTIFNLNSTVQGKKKRELCNLSRKFLPLWYPKHVWNIPPLVLIPYYFKIFIIITLYFCNIHFNFILLCIGVQYYLFRKRFMTAACIYYFPCSLYTPSVSSSMYVKISKNVGSF
jgi:hypothetical protein